MSYQAYGPNTAYSASVTDRMTFIRRTYAHLAGAIGLFVAASAAFYMAGTGEAIARFIAESGYGWYLLLGGFMVAGYGAQSLARSRRSMATQYLGLGIYAFAEAIIFSPLIFIAARVAPGILPQATIMTLAVFFGLTAFTFLSKSDFSFLGSILAVLSFVILGIIIVALVFGISLGMWFCGALVLFASAAVVYSTSNVIRAYPTDQYVAAALDLFAAIALLFWYIISFLLGSQRR